MVANTHILDFSYGGNIQGFLAQGSSVFSDLWDLLDRQFDRLSRLQQQIMYSLAINREAVMPTKLQEEILPKEKRSLNHSYGIKIRPTPL